MFLPIELFNGKSMGKNSSIITKSTCIIPYSPIIIMRNLLKNNFYGYFMEILPWKSSSSKIRGKKIGKECISVSSGMFTGQ